MAMTQDEGRAPGFATRLFDGLPGRYDRLAEVLSLAQNRRWRAAMVDPVVRSRPASVLDVATGPGGVALQLASRTTAIVTAVDITPEMIRRAQVNVAAHASDTRVRLVLGDARRLPFPDRCFDGLTFTYLLRYVEDPGATIQELARVVRPGGAVASLEFYVPEHPIWRALWWGYTRAVLPTAGYLAGGREWFDVGRFLGPSISAHYQRYPLSWHVGAWRDAGLTDIQTRVMSVGGGLVMWGVRT
jgi:demethylmenaquinone methyltransferase/2-methoxy-6-polyprenyl-1,4-benzoquinol methylase